MKTKEEIRERNGEIYKTGYNQALKDVEKMIDKFDFSVIYNDNKTILQMEALHKDRVRLKQKLQKLKEKKSDGKKRIT